MSGKLVLYDIPSRPPLKCWSIMTLKTRLLLNYKNLPYETEWIEYPDIKSKFEGKVEPTEEGLYTVPVVRFPDGSYVRDSREIAKRIEKDYPEPSAHLDRETSVDLEFKIMPKLGKEIAPDFVPKIPQRLLNEASIGYWYRTREAFFGKPLDQVEQELGGDTAWMNGSPYLQEITELLKKNKSGPFFEGDQVSYADFVWVSYLRFMQRIGDDVFIKSLEASGDQQPHKMLLEACQAWLSRDDN